MFATDRFFASIHGVTILWSHKFYEIKRLDAPKVVQKGLQQINDNT